MAEKVMKKTQSPLPISAKSAYITDESGRVEVYAKDAERRLPIASMCKIMTLILTFEAIEEGKFSYDDLIPVSERAASMGGSQVFLEANAKYSASDLIKSIVVCSANDSCVALAEKISGSEETFTAEMNEKAKQLGANNTLFANCTGLPKEPQYSCAKDVAIMLKELVSHKKYFEYGNVWMDKFQHPEGRYTEISNTNKLIRYYDGCDGGKTGFTSQAGFCLAATACRDGMRVIAVVIGEENSKTRFADVRKMFDYTFANYTQTTVVDDVNPLEKPAYVNGGKQKTATLRAERCVKIFSRRNEMQNITTELNVNERIAAPLKKGAKVGEITVYKDGVMIDRVAILSNETVAKANLFDRFKDVSKNWTLRRK
ncbi:MAG: D-alanyl-D-alanine carboxypeptidase [Clostridia bacterium]|nr:D-alanyl-D-alanine carboxypeptidase [Clostridia bacterium]